MSNAVPVITIDKFGGPVLFDNTSSYLYSGNTLEEYKQSLMMKIAKFTLSII